MNLLVSFLHFKMWPRFRLFFVFIVLTLLVALTQIVVESFQWRVHNHDTHYSINPHYSSSVAPYVNDRNRRTSLSLARDRNRNNNLHNYNDNKRRYNNYDSTTVTTVTRQKNTFSHQYWYPNILAQQQQQQQQIEEGSETQSQQPQFLNIETNTYSESEQEKNYDTFLLDLEQQSVSFIAHRIRQRLSMLQSSSTNESHDDDTTTTTTATTETSRIPDIVRCRFMDLTCTQRGEDILEHLLATSERSANDDPTTSTTTLPTSIIDPDDSVSTMMVIRGAVIILQSLCVMGTQVGVKGPPEQLRRMVDHLSDSVRTTTTKAATTTKYSTTTAATAAIRTPTYEEQLLLMDYNHWTKDSVRRLKYRLDRTPAIELLATLQWKQTPQGAFDLLRALGVWDTHEDLALLRSGFPIRFTNREEQMANDIWYRRRNDNNNGPDATTTTKSTDPDTLLGIRQDLRHLKVYTIDGADAAEIDDGISIESIIQPSQNIHDGTGPDPSKTKESRYRIWVHIADAESYAPPDSDLFEIARRRVTSLYLPTGSIAMFPTIVGSDLMSLKVNEDVRALSLGVELNDDGSLNESTIIVTPSLIKISYRLTYDEVDEMLEEGIGYNEEWEIGALLMAAKKRREFRIRNGSSEGMIPNPVPSSSVSIYSDQNSPDAIGISINIQVSHNAAMNKTAAAEQATQNNIVHEDPASSAYLLVTEAMIMAGEAIGVWKRVIDTSDSAHGTDGLRNVLRLPFRTQSPPDFKGRARERNVMMDLMESNAGMGLCHAWYTRRFLESVIVKDSPMPHSGLGLNCYVQWSSPIRRFSDLQVHAAVKRYIRRRRVYELWQSGESVPDEIRAVDLGIPPDALHNGCIKTTSLQLALDDIDQDLDYMDGIGLVGAGKKLQRQSQQYWLFEYVRRLKETNPETTFNVVILGCVDPDRFQFAIYVKELGLEHRYTSPAGRMEPGTEFRVRVDSVSPRSGLLSFVRVV